MIQKVLKAQLATLLIITGLLCFFWGTKAGMSFLLAGLSLALPNIFCAWHMFLGKYSIAFLWMGLVANKFVAVLLLLISVKLLGEPQWLAFILGVLVISHVPLVYGFYKSISQH